MLLLRPLDIECGGDTNCVNDIDVVVANVVVVVASCVNDALAYCDTH